MLDHATAAPLPTAEFMAALVARGIRCWAEGDRLYVPKKVW